MVDILRRCIKSESTRNWSLQLQSVYDMLPYFAAAGHRLYAKSGYIYLHMSREFQNTHPNIYKKYQNGFHCVRGRDPPICMNEQVLMLTVKTSGGLTRDKGLSETQRLVF